MNKYIVFAVLAAVFYAMSVPLSKILLDRGLSSTMLAGFLYLGAGLGMTFFHLKKKDKKEAFSKREIKYVVLMVVLDILAPISLMIGLKMNQPETVSLLNNFEIVATSLIAYFLFREKIKPRLWVALVIITLATVLLSIEDVNRLSFSFGSLFVILACIFWGLENNCTRALSHHYVQTIVLIKGIFSGIGALLVAFLVREWTWQAAEMGLALILGFVSYGLSVYFYVYAQRGLGASRTSMYYAIAPFIGVVLSFILFFEIPQPTFYIALALMAVGTYFASTESQKKIE
ncbi:MAG: DMT family transporter [Bacilli bacterium]|nr:DMT family transporter [Bacilli bacterium]